MGGPHSGDCVSRTSESGASWQELVKNHDKKSFGLRHVAQRRLTLAQLLSAVPVLLLWLGLTIAEAGQLASIFVGKRIDRYSIETGCSDFSHVSERVSGDGGTSDAPLVDRAVTCVRRKRTFQAQSVGTALNLAGLLVADSSGNATDGYRLMEREEKQEPSLQMLLSYSYKCQLLASTMTGVMQLCKHHGYNVTSGNLRVLRGVESQIVVEIPNSLPFLFVPEADRSVTARVVVPASTGPACTLHLNGMYLSPRAEEDPMLELLDASTIKDRVLNWLNASEANASWKNGWFQKADSATKWYVFMGDTNPDNKGLAISLKRWNLNGLMQLKRTTEAPQILQNGLGVLLASRTVSSIHVSIANGTNPSVGLFYDQEVREDHLSVRYSWQMCLANCTMLSLLLRWFLCIVATYQGYCSGQSDWDLPSIGCLANSSTFLMLPCLLLPRLQAILVAFWSSGLEMSRARGLQIFCDSWYVMYAAQAEFIVLLYSVINIASRALRRRTSDVLFGPSLLVLFLLHRFRATFFADNPVASSLSPQDASELAIFDFMRSTTMLDQIGAGVRSVFGIKIALIVINVCPLLLSSSTDRERSRATVSVASIAGTRRNAINSISITRNCASMHAAGPVLVSNKLKVEKMLGITASQVGGIGHSRVYEPLTLPDGNVSKSLSGYELLRLGFLVYDNRYVMSFGDLGTVLFVRPLQLFSRVCLYQIDHGTHGIARMQYVGASEFRSKHWISLNICTKKLC